MGEKLLYSSFFFIVGFFFYVFGLDFIKNIYGNLVRIKINVFIFLGCIYVYLYLFV